jgi:hypothetical protein
MEPPARTELFTVGAMRASASQPHPKSVNPAVMLLANKSLAFSLYDFNLEGISVEELATAYSLPVNWVEQRIEAVRMCLKYQVKLSVGVSAEPKLRAA